MISVTPRKFWFGSWIIVAAGVALLLLRLDLGLPGGRLGMALAGLGTGLAGTVRWSHPEMFQNPRTETFERSRLNQILWRGSGPNSRPSLRWSGAAMMLGGSLMILTSIVG